MSESSISYSGSLLFDLANRPAEQRMGLLLGVHRSHSESVITDKRQEEVTLRSVIHVQAFRTFPRKVWTSARSGEEAEAAVSEWITSLIPELELDQVILGIYHASGAPEVPQ